MAGTECSYLSLVCFILLLFLNFQLSIRCPHLICLFNKHLLMSPSPSRLDTMDTEVLPAVCLEITGDAIPANHYSQA